MIAAGVSSPRRLRVGLLRDTVAEMELVTGDGRLIASGARTVKNVTGYDVHRLATGSLGTLGVIVQVALKVRPLPEAAATLATVDGRARLARTRRSTRCRCRAVVAEPERRGGAARGMARRGGREQTAPRDAAGRCRALRHPRRGGARRDRSSLEAAVPPSRLEALVEGRRAGARSSAWASRGSGCATPDEVAAIRERAAELGGIAPAVRGPGGLGDATIPGLEIHRRLKAAFDPAGVLAPGRFWGGI